MRGTWEKREYEGRGDIREGGILGKKGY